MAKDKNAKKNKKDSMVLKSDKDKTIKRAREELHFEKSNDTDLITKLIKIILIVTGIIIVFYGVTVVVTRRATAVKTAELGVNNEKAKIQYDKIVIGSMLKIDGSFYVLIQEEDDQHEEEYSTMLQTIEANEDSARVFTADLSSSFNKKYYSEKSNYDSDLTNFKVSGTTLVKIDNHSISSVYGTYDEIKSKLSELE